MTFNPDRRRTVLITGCSAGGIGHALAKEYHSKGLRVIATARRTETLTELVTLGIETLELEVTSIASVRAVRDAVSLLTGGSLDILVNNAGQSYSVPATDIDLTEVKTMFDVNVIAVMCMVQEFINLLIASGDARIVNIGSIAGVMPFPFGSAYNATKAALHSYGNTLRLELAPFNIQVMTIITGGVKSKIERNTRPIQPSSLYAPIADIFAQHRASRSQEGALSTDVYAQRVVSQTLRRSAKAWYWTGTFTFRCWFIDTFLWRTGFDWLFSYFFGFSTLKKYLKGEKKRI